MSKKAKQQVWREGDCAAVGCNQKAGGHGWMSGPPCGVGFHGLCPDHAGRAAALRYFSTSGEAWR